MVVDKGLKLMIGVFVVVLLGVVLLGVLAAEEAKIRVTNTIVNESVEAPQNSTQYSLGNDDLLPDTETVVCVTR